MTIWSKLHYNCYEFGHPHTPSCTYASLEMALIALQQSAQFYGILYTVSGLARLRRVGGMNWKVVRSLLEDWARSVAFIVVNAAGFAGAICLFRHIIRHLNYLTVGFLPAVVSSGLAIVVERPERRPLLALYLANISSECVWLWCVSKGYMHPLPYGKELILVTTMAVLGYYFKTDRPLNKYIHSLMRYIFGSEESGEGIQTERDYACNRKKNDSTDNKLTVRKLILKLTGKHHKCPHKNSCLYSMAMCGVHNFLAGWGLRTMLTCISGAPRQLMEHPWKMISLPVNAETGLCAAAAAISFKGICCVCRHLLGREQAFHGGLAGAAAGVVLAKMAPKSIILYLMWKTLQSLYERGCDNGLLLRIPMAAEVIYSLAVGVAFHLAVVEEHHMKPSYRTFLNSVTGGRYSTINRQLLEPWGLNSGRNFTDTWPDYDLRYVSQHMKELLTQRDIHIISSESVQ